MEPQEIKMLAIQALIDVRRKSEWMEELCFQYQKRIQRRGIIDLVSELQFKGEGVEVGVYKGDFSKTILEISKLSKLHLVDPWKEYDTNAYKDGLNVSQEEQEKLYQEVCEKLQPYQNRINIIRKESIPASQDFADESLDFVYIDANHDYKHAKEDIQHWYPKLRYGGLMAGHDYKNGKTKLSKIPFGVKSAVLEICEIKYAQLFLMPNATLFSKKILQKRTLSRRTPQWYFIKNLL